MTLLKITNVLLARRIYFGKEKRLLFSLILEPGPASFEARHDTPYITPAPDAKISDSIYD